MDSSLLTPREKMKISLAGRQKEQEGRTPEPPELEVPWGEIRS